jgi:hypothetical protein
MFVPGSRLELFPQAGHFPHLDDPLRFVGLLIDFMETSEPAHVDAGRWSELLRSGADEFAASPRPPEAVGLRRPAKSAAERRSTG